MPWTRIVSPVGLVLKTVRTSGPTMLLLFSVVLERLSLCL